jgi:hypothetical protein
MDQFINLGTAAVLDASKLVPGSYVEIDKEVFVVGKVVDDLHVYFRPASFWELVRYRCWSQFSSIGKILIYGIIVVGMWFLIRKMGL